MSPRLPVFLFAVAALVACGSRADRRAAATATSEEAPEELPQGVSRSASVMNPFDTMQVKAMPAPPGEGFVHLNGGRTWFKVTGESKNGIPAILIHDGPGGASFSMKSLEGLNDERPVVRYDQVGGGKSEAVFNPVFFTFSHYVLELDSIRLHFGYSKVHLVAHSFGAVIALEYYKAHPNNVASLTLESPEFDYPLLLESIKRRIKELPDSMRIILEAKPMIGTTSRADYQVALMEFVRRNVCCKKVSGPDMDSMSVSVNDSAYSQLRGQNEVLINGSLAGYSATSMLKSVTVPVLYTVGENDVADPATIQRFASMTPNARVVVIKGINHFPMWEAPEENLRIVRDFLRQVDGSTPRR